MKKLFQLMLEHLQQGEDLVLVTIIASSGATPRGIGARMLVGRSGRICGTIGGGAVEYRSEQIAAKVLDGFDIEIVEKHHMDLPEKLIGVVRCKNPRCITSTEQELQHEFRLTDRENRVYRCVYCETKA